MAARWLLSQYHGHHSSDAENTIQIMDKIGGRIEQSVKKACASLTFRRTIEGFSDKLSCLRLDSLELILIWLL